MPWRNSGFTNNYDLYHILVSEIMLQQTQVNRVTQKYLEFIKTFPTLDALAQAPLSKVLKMWQGLGYNRRAKYLHQAAKALVENPSLAGSPESLATIKGIGPNTAKAILVYSKNQSHAFIETNIRTSYIYYFFKDKQNVNDPEILQLVSKTTDPVNPREWCWALMDYGTHIKATIGNSSSHSKTYKKQSKFEGSRRQLRGLVLNMLRETPQSASALSQIEDERIGEVLAALEQEGLITKHSRQYALAD